MLQFSGIQSPNSDPASSNTHDGDMQSQHPTDPVGQARRQTNASPHTSRPLESPTTGEKHSVHSVTEPENHVFPAGIATSMVRTVVSNGEDALNLLFEAAHHTHHDHGNKSTRSAELALGDRRSPLQNALRGGATPITPAHSTLYGKRPSACVMASGLPADLVETWTAYRFVRMGWFSVEEAVTYVDL